MQDLSCKTLKDLSRKAFFVNQGSDKATLQNFLDFSFNFFAGFGETEKPKIITIYKLELQKGKDTQIPGQKLQIAIPFYIFK